GDRSSQPNRRASTAVLHESHTRLLRGADNAETHFYSVIRHSRLSYSLHGRARPKRSSSDPTTAAAVHQQRRHCQDRGDDRRGGRFPCASIVPHEPVRRLRVPEVELQVHAAEGNNISVSAITVDSDVDIVAATSGSPETGPNMKVY